MKLELFKIAAKRNEEIEKQAFVGAAIGAAKGLGRVAKGALKALPGKGPLGKAMTGLGVVGTGAEIAGAASKGSRMANKRGLYQAGAQLPKTNTF